jgi:uncharacterized protein (DUF362 family)
MTQRSRFCEVFRLKGLSALVDNILGHLPEGDFGKILIKPNWVKHQENERFPIAALVTDSRVIDAAIRACIEKYSSLTEIIVGDVPLQSCDWDVLKRQSGVDLLIEKYGQYRKPQIRFLDLRRERVNVRSGVLEKSSSASFGDPKGYREIQLDSSSFLDSISDARHRFRVSDYRPEQTTSSHRRGFHRYLISGSALDCELFVNLPKMKTHQKAGITGALKNLVGINGEKAYLVHYRKGKTVVGGDEFPPGTPWPVVLQTKLRTSILGRYAFAFAVFRYGWVLLRRLYGIEVEGTPENLGKRFYCAAGSWYGNDSIWRMVYDLNRIVRYAPRNGSRLSNRPQREYVAIMDGIVAGEGNGPLQPLPVELNTLLVSNDAFLMDCTAARLMGFDAARIPMLSNRDLFGDDSWGHFDAEVLNVKYDGKRIEQLQDLPILHQFRPPPGWRGRIELTNELDNELEATYLP